MKEKAQSTLVAIGNISNFAKQNISIARKASKYRVAKQHIDGTVGAVYRLKRKDFYE